MAVELLLLMGNYYFLLIDMYLTVPAMTQCLCSRDYMGSEEEDISQRERA